MQQKVSTVGIGVITYRLKHRTPGAVQVGNATPLFLQRYENVEPWGEEPPQLFPTSCRTPHRTAIAIQLFIVPVIVGHALVVATLSFSKGPSNNLFVLNLCAESTDLMNHVLW